MITSTQKLVSGTNEYRTLRALLEDYLELHNLVRENGSRKDGSEPSGDEVYVWNLFAAMCDGETVSQVVANYARKKMEL